MSRAALLAIVVVTTLALALVAWYLRADPATPSATNAPPHISVAAPAKFTSMRAGESTAIPLRTITHTSRAAKSPDYAAQFLGASDLLIFLEALAPAAADGDVDALYYMGRGQQALHA